MAHEGIWPPGYESPSLREEADRTSENKHRANCETCAGNNQQKRVQVKCIRKLLLRQQHKADAKGGTGHSRKAWIEALRGSLRNVAHREHHNQYHEENQRADVRDGAKDESRREH